jgi:hypothetical protein
VEPHGGDDVSPRSWPAACGCGSQIHRSECASSGQGLPLGQEAGGFKRFAEIVHYFLRNGSPPANASQEMAELLVGLTGLPAVATACA